MVVWLWENGFGCFPKAGAYLEIAFCQMYVTICGNGFYRNGFSGMLRQKTEGMKFGQDSTGSTDEEEKEYKVYVKDAEEAGSAFSFRVVGFRRIIRTAGAD